jgi:hypothetical protein
VDDVNRNWLRVFFACESYILQNCLVNLSELTRCYSSAISHSPRHITQQNIDMRFLKFWDNSDYCLINHIPDPIPIYGVLSYRWGAARDEITYEELKDGTRRSISEDGLARPGFRKIKFCRERAVADGLRYFWMDTCCIDKQNEVELSYALNSMFYWYQKAARCYVYLSDVSSPMGQISTFESSEWFTRSWTL